MDPGANLRGEFVPSGSSAGDVNDQNFVVAVHMYLDRIANLLDTSTTLN